VTKYEAQFQRWGIIQWKSLTWVEYKKFQESTNFKSPMAVSNDIYRACIITGPDVQTATAGVIEFVVKHVFQGSAFTGSYQILDEKINGARQKLNDNYLLSATAVISSIFGYKFEEIDAWDEDTFLIRLAQAEFVAGKPLNVGKDETITQEVQPTPINTKKPKKELTMAQQMVLDRTRGNK
jgi:hypothetical protein